MKLRSITGSRKLLFPSGRHLRRKNRCKYAEAGSRIKIDQRFCWQGGSLQSRSSQFMAILLHGNAARGQKDVDFKGVAKCASVGEQNGETRPGVDED